MVHTGKFLILIYAITLGLVFSTGFSNIVSAQDDYPELKKGVVKIIVKKADNLQDTGAGIVVGIDKNTAFVLTAYHVIENAQKIQVVFFDKQHIKFAGNGFEKFNEDLDMAIVIVGPVEGRELPDDFPNINLSDISQLKKGDKISAIGHPLNFEWLASDNTIAKVSDPDDSRMFRFTKAAIERGNSGGPVFKKKDLIGMVLKYDSLHAKAVKINDVKQLLDEWRIQTNKLTKTKAPGTDIPPEDIIKITATGTARLKDQTRAKAEDEALKNAYQIAVKKGLDTFEKGANSNFESDRIISQSERYILQHEKLREWDDGENVNIKIRTDVARHRIKADLGSSIKGIEDRIGNPVIAFVLTAWEVPEAAGAKKHLEGQILIDAFQEQFKNRGFDIKAADEAREFANTGIGKLAVIASKGRKEVAKYAREANANYLARGEITATYKGIDQSTGSHEWTGTISCEIINAATAELSASYSKTVIKLFPDKIQGLSALMHSAAKNAARTLATQTRLTWQGDARIGRVYEIIVENVVSRRNHARKLLNVLQKFCAIRNEHYDSQKKRMVVDVIFKGSAKKLEDNIMDDKDMEKFRNFDLSKKSGNQLIFTF